MTILRRKAFELTLLLTLIASPRVATADDLSDAEAERRAEARAHFAAGTTAYAEGRLEEACPELESARVLVPTSFVTAWNASMCWESQGRLDLALASLSLFSSAPEGFDLEQRRRTLAERITLRADQGEPIPPTAEPARATDVVDVVEVSPEAVPPVVQPVAPAPVALSDASTDRDDTLLHWLFAGSLVIASGALVTTLVLELPRSEEPVSLRIATLRFE